MVIDSRKDPSAASAGGILVTRLMMRSAEGVVTDGGFRDSPEIGAMDVHAYHARPSAPTNLTRHQAIDLNVPIGFGDGEGVVAIPAHLADEVADEAVEMTAFEDFVTERVQGGATITGLYPPTDPANLDLFAE